MMTAVLGCGVSEIGGSGGDGSTGGGIWGGLNDLHSGTTSVRKVCYMTAMEYPKGYDWRVDESRETVKCSLVVYEEGTPVMKIPVGDAYEVSPDPDMHRIIDGHLYTDYSGAYETVIKCDGRQMFRYPGREYIYGMELIDGELYTLGQSRDGKGFALRKNAEVVLARDNAIIIGRLRNDHDSLCFAFCEQLLNIGRPLYRYYASVNGEVFQVAVREDIKNVWDVLVCHDKVIYVASLMGVNTPVLVTGDLMVQLPCPSGTSLVSCKIFRSGALIGVEGICRLRNGALCNMIWLDGERLCAYIGKGDVAALQVDGDGLFFVMNPPDRSSCGSIYRAGELSDMPTGYTVMGDNCVQVVDGILQVGLSSLDGLKPIIWKDGIVDSLDMNGYISSICQITSVQTTSPKRVCGTDPD